MKYQIRSTAMLNLISTNSGLRVKDMRFNAALKVWFGSISGVPHAWDSDGKCIDRKKPELDFLIHNNH